MPRLPARMLHLGGRLATKYKYKFKFNKKSIRIMGTNKIKNQFTNPPIH